MLKVDEAIEIILANTKVLKSEKVGILESLNRVLAEDICADLESPIFDKFEYSESENSKVKIL